MPTERHQRIAQAGCYDLSIVNGPATMANQVAAVGMRRIGSARVKLGQSLAETIVVVVAVVALRV